MNRQRSTLRELYLSALEAFPELGQHDALAVLAIASTLALGRQASSSKIVAVLRRGGASAGGVER